MRQSVLRSCPTCGGDYDPEALGLRDYTWLNDLVPGGSDIDFALEQKDSGRVLLMEFKSQGERLPLGQRLLLKTLVRKGCDVWVVWQRRDGRLDRLVMTGSGKLVQPKRLGKPAFGALVDAWWTEGLDED